MSLSQAIRPLRALSVTVIDSDGITPCFWLPLVLLKPSAEAKNPTVEVAPGPNDRKIWPVQFMPAGEALKIQRL
jgi:hypothetical protein